MHQRVLVLGNCSKLSFSLMERYLDPQQAASASSFLRWWRTMLGNHPLTNDVVIPPTPPASHPTCQPPIHPPSGARYDVVYVSRNVLSVILSSYFSNGGIVISSGAVFSGAGSVSTVGNEVLLFGDWFEMGLPVYIDD